MNEENWMATIKEFFEERIATGRAVYSLKAETAE